MVPPKEIPPQIIKVTKLPLKYFHSSYEIISSFFKEISKRKRAKIKKRKAMILIKVINYTF